MSLKDDLIKALGYIEPALELATTIAALTGIAPLAVIGEVASAGVKALEDGLTAGTAPADVTAQIRALGDRLTAGAATNDAAADAYAAQKFGVDAENPSP